MITNLAHAPSGIPLSLVHITDTGLATRLARLGLFEGTKLTRLGETVSIGPVKIKGPKGETVLGGGLAERIVIHLDNSDKRLPLPECLPRSTGHIEGITGDQTVENALEKLGLADNDHITVIRRIPPMTYKILVDGTHYEQINESLAAVLVGDTPTGSAQFCAVGTGEAFVVRHILADQNSRDVLTATHIEPGARLELQSVSSSPVLNFSDSNPVVAETGDGLRLYFNELDAHDLIVSTSE